MSLLSHRPGQRLQSHQFEGRPSSLARCLLRLKDMRQRVTALTVHQWLPSWDQVRFCDENHRRRPEARFLLLSMEASNLRRLAGIQRRSPSGARAQDTGIQRILEKERSQEIADYVQYGFPWSSVSKQRRAQSEFANLVKPGWLPTAIILNILGPGEERKGRTVHVDDQVFVQFNDDGIATVDLPDASLPDWSPSQLPPLEIIDGQHRLFAFDEIDSDSSGYQVPVVAFYGLDVSWQAYLFYVINIKPKRINRSLAFDLYPLLRTEEWLQPLRGPYVYREARSQELTEALWAHPQSPWHQRINMLGERRGNTVKQASWVRSLQATLVKNWRNPRFGIGGLFGGPELPWSRAQQAAFLIYGWSALEKAVRDVTLEWANALRALGDGGQDEAFKGDNTLLNSDIGVRGYLYVLNDLSFIRADAFDLHSWTVQDDGASAVDAEAVSQAICSLAKTKCGEAIREMARTVAQYDWRLSKAPGLTEIERQAKARFRGGTGYRELRIDIFRHIQRVDGPLSGVAAEVLALLKV